MILDSTKFRNNYRRMMYNTEHAIVTRFNDPEFVWIKYDSKLKNMQENLKNAHRAAMEHINES